MIQSVINRLAGNTFLIKGWTITLVTAILALAVQQKSGAIASLSAFSTVILAGLDTYYLRLERLFRCLYIRADLDTSSGGSFPMDTTSCRDDPHCRWGRVAIAPSITALYLPLAAVGIGTASWLTWPV